MSLRNFVFIAFSLELFFGCVSSQSGQCNNAAMGKCANVKEGFGICRKFSDIQSCLEKILPECTDDSMILKLESGIASLNTKSQKCTDQGMYSCFHTELHKCEEKVPYWRKYQINKSEAGKRTHCATFRSEASVATACVKGLKERCSHSGAHDAIELSLKNLEDLEELCADY